MNELIIFMKSSASADPKLFKFECKQAHIQAKSYVRGTYLQKAKDWLDEKIDYLTNVKD